MGIAKAKFEDILKTIFTEGNVIRLFSTTPDEKSETGGVLLAGKGVVDYTITANDFNVNGGIVTSKRNIMLFLYDPDDESSTITADGFGIYEGSKLQYFGKFNEPLIISYNDVPAIKIYNADKGEGIRIEVTSEQKTDASATTT